jgi:hypothetical protein
MRHAGARTLREDDQARRPAPPRLRLVERDAGPLEAPPPERRTITITGTPGHAAAPRRRRSPAQQQIAARPDRVALWAFLLGLFLVLVAAATAGAAV